MIGSPPVKSGTDQFIPPAHHPAEAVTTLGGDGWASTDTVLLPAFVT